MNRFALACVFLTFAALPGCVFDVGCRDGGRDHRPHWRANPPTVPTSSERK